MLLNESHLLHLWLQKHCPESELNSTHKSWERLTWGVWQLFISVSCRGQPSITHVQHVRQGAASVQSLCRRSEVKRFRVQEVRRERFFISRCGIVRTVKRSVVPSAVTDAYMPCFLEASQSGEKKKNLLISIQLRVIMSAHFTLCLRSLRKTFLSHLDLRQVRVLKKGKNHSCIWWIMHTDGQSFKLSKSTIIQSNWKNSIGRVKERVCEEQQ